MELKIRIRQTQYYAIEATSTGLAVGDPIIYAGSNPASLSPVLGTTPDGGTWRDITKDVANLDKLQLTWTTDRDLDGLSVPGAFAPKKTSSGSLIIEGEAYQFIRSWLVDNVAAPINTIDVQIEHVGCGTYDDWVIKSKQITWCEGEICEFSINLQQLDPAYQCIQKTLISDNWQGWFKTVPDGGKKHPRFAYCNEVRPNGMMIMLWWLSSALFTIVILLYLSILPIVWIIQAIVGVILSIIDAISWLFGGSPDFDDNFNFTDPQDFIDSLGSFYVESSGCGRLHPAPLVRDYIDNVCKKCGVRVDAITAPIFYAENINIQTGAEREDGAKIRENPHYYATYMNAPIERGIRIFSGLFSNNENTTDFYIERNRPILALDMFLDELKTLYNAEWRLINVGTEPTLYFWRKDWYELGSPILDFSSNGEDRIKILQGVCFSWLDKKQHAYMRGLYSQDASDTCGNEALGHMNDIISLGDVTNNPTYDGELDKTSQFFGGTRFRLDGTSTDYICDGVQVVLNGSLFSFFIPTIVKNMLLPNIKAYADYVLLMSGETSVLPKLLIWDKNSGYEYARAIRNKTVNSSNGSDKPMPERAPYYNKEMNQWDALYPPKTHVLGSGLTFGSEPYAVYTVQGYLGEDFYRRPAEIINYPMFFNSQFKDTLYDWFHWIDDPRINPKINMQWDVKIELCCENLQKLKVFGDASTVQLMQKALLPLQYFNEGTITEITVDYEGDDYGKHIQIKGVV